MYINSTVHNTMMPKKKGTNTYPITLLPKNSTICYWFPVGQRLTCETALLDTVIWETSYIKHFLYTCAGKFLGEKGDNLSMQKCKLIGGICLWRDLWMVNVAKSKRRDKSRQVYWKICLIDKQSFYSVCRSWKPNNCALYLWLYFQYKSQWII